MADVIEIQKGDTLTYIARDRNTTVPHLATTNGISNPDLIYAGDPLVVPSRPAGPNVMSTAPTQPRAPVAPTQSPHPPAMPGADTPPATPDAPAQPQAPAPDAPPEAVDGVEEGEEAAEEKTDEEPEEVVCNCPADYLAKEDEEDEADDGKPPIVRAGGNENVDALYLEGDIDGEADGVLGHGQMQARAGMLRTEGATHFGETPFGGAQQNDVMTAGIDAQGGVVSGLGGTVKADAAMMQGQGTLFVGNDENNPLAEGGGSYGLMTAEARGNLLLGNDGTRRGLAVGAGLEAAAAQGDLVGGFNIPIPFTDWTISGQGKLGGKLGAVGAGGNAHLMQDLDTGRVHLGLMGEAALLLGGKLGFDLSIGPAYDDRQRPNGP